MEGRKCSRQRDLGNGIWVCDCDATEQSRRSYWSVGAFYLQRGASFMLTQEEVLQAVKFQEVRVYRGQEDEDLGASRVLVYQLDSHADAANLVAEHNGYLHVLKEREKERGRRRENNMHLIGKAKIPQGTMEDFKRPNHNDFRLTRELHMQSFSGIRRNELSGEYEIWVEGDILARFPTEVADSNPQAFEDFFKEVFLL